MEEIHGIICLVCTHIYHKVLQQKTLSSVDYHSKGLYLSHTKPMPIRRPPPSQRHATQFLEPLRLPWQGLSPKVTHHFHSDFTDQDLSHEPC